MYLTDCDCNETRKTGPEEAFLLSKKGSYFLRKYRVDSRVRALQKEAREQAPLQKVPRIGRGKECLRPKSEEISHRKRKISGPSGGLRDYCETNLVQGMSEGRDTLSFTHGHTLVTKPFKARSRLLWGAAGKPTDRNWAEQDQRWSQLS